MSPPEPTPAPRPGDEPAFREPWEAQAFALAVALHRQGLFTWSEWAETLADEIRRAQASGHPDDGSTYYRHWLAALERLATARGATTPEALAARRAAWESAVRATPHGRPILLENDPQR